MILPQSAPQDSRKYSNVRNLNLNETMYTTKRVLWKQSFPSVNYNFNILDWCYPADIGWILFVFVYLYFRYISYNSMYLIVGIALSDDLTNTLIKKSVVVFLFFFHDTPVKHQDTPVHWKFYVPGSCSYKMQITYIVHENKASHL